MPRRWLIQIWGLLPNLAYKELAEKLPPTPFSQYFSSISSWPAIRFQRLGLGLYIVLSSRPAGELGAHKWDSSSGIKGRPKCWLRVEGAPLLCQLLSALHLLRAAPPRLLSSSPALLEPASQSSPTPQAQPVYTLLWAAELLCQPRGSSVRDPASAQNSLHFCDGNMAITAPFSLFYLPVLG